MNPSDTFQHLKIELCSLLNLDPLCTQIFFSIPYSDEVILLSKSLRQTDIRDGQKILADIDSKALNPVSVYNPASSSVVPRGLTVVGRCVGKKCMHLNVETEKFLGFGIFDIAKIQKKTKCLYCPDRCFDSHPPLDLIDYKLSDCKVRAYGTKRDKRNFPITFNQPSFTRIRGTDREFLRELIKDRLDSLFLEIKEI